MILPKEPMQFQWEAFDESFTGISLQFEPSENFEPGGKPASVLRYAKKRLKGTGHSDCVCCPYYIDLFLDRHYKSCFFPYFYGSAADRRESGLGISFSHRNDSHGSGTVDCYVDSAGIFPEDQWKAGYGWKCHLYVEKY